MRAFIAIELPEEIKTALLNSQKKLRACGADVKWVEAKNIHLTLKFLGEIDEARRKSIEEILEAAAATQNPYTIQISSAGAYPAMHSPRVIWAGIDRGDRETKDLAKILEEKIEKTGIPKEERPFSSHITIGRTRSGMGRENLIEGLEGLAKDYKEMPLEFLAGKITLFKSTLTPSGPVYDAVKEASFATP
jgi:RNA 2',3'-cyclic 3'-phosphodiesterase